MEPGIRHAAKGTCYFFLKQLAQCQAHSQGLMNSSQEQKHREAVSLATGKGRVWEMVTWIGSWAGVVCMTAKARKDKW